LQRTLFDLRQLLPHGIDLLGRWPRDEVCLELLRRPDKVTALRKREPQMARPYRAWGYPAAPIIFILFAIWLVVSTIINDFRDSAIGVGIILLGLPAYYYSSRKKR